MYQVLPELDQVHKGILPLVGNKKRKKQHRKHREKKPGRRIRASLPR